MDLRALDELIKRGQSSVKELNENTCSTMSGNI